MKARCGFNSASYKLKFVSIQDLIRKRGKETKLRSLLDEGQRSWHLGRGSLTRRRKVSKARNLCHFNGADG